MLVCNSGDLSYRLGLCVRACNFYDLSFVCMFVILVISLVNKQVVGTHACNFYDFNFVCVYFLQIQICVRACTCVCVHVHVILTTHFLCMHV